MAGSVPLAIGWSTLTTPIRSTPVHHGQGIPSTAARSMLIQHDQERALYTTMRVPHTPVQEQAQLPARVGYRVQHGQNMPHAQRGQGIPITLAGQASSPPASGSRLHHPG